MCSRKCSSIRARQLEIKLSYFLYQSRVKRIRETSQALDSRGIGVSRVDDHIVGLWHKNRSHLQENGVTLPNPSISPGTGHRRPVRPVGRVVTHRPSRAATLPSSVERFVPGESPDNHVRQKCRVRSRSTAPRQQGPRTRWQAIATACDRPTRIWVRAAKPRHTRVFQRRSVGRGP